MKKLADDLHDGMCALVDKISNRMDENLKSVVVEGNSYDVGDELIKVWKTHRKQQNQNFVNDQEINVKFSKFC